MGRIFVNQTATSIAVKNSDRSPKLLSGQTERRLSCIHVAVESGFWANSATSGLFVRNKADGQIYTFR